MPPACATFPSASAAGLIAMTLRPIGSRREHRWSRRRRRSRARHRDGSVRQLEPDDMGSGDRCPGSGGADRADSLPGRRRRLRQWFRWCPSRCCSPTMSRWCGTAFWSTATWRWTSRRPESAASPCASPQTTWNWTPPAGAQPGTTTTFVVEALDAESRVGRSEVTLVVPNGTVLSGVRDRIQRSAGSRSSWRPVPTPRRPPLAFGELWVLAGRR